MICPWCMHCGAFDEDYVFDAERYCGICAQQMPRGRDRWIAAMSGLNAEMCITVEQELNKIVASKSGLKADVVKGIGEAIDAFIRLRTSGMTDYGAHQLEQFARWLDFACTYYPPN